jgi:hypothetical protein
MVRPRDPGVFMENFYTDVISHDARFDSASRVADSALLEPITGQLVQSIIAAAQQMGIALMVYETYRSQARQQELFDNGATKLRKVGVHHYGLACDIVRVVGGEPSWKGDFSFLGQLAHSAGLIGEATGARRKSNTVLSTACTSSAAPLPVRLISSPAVGILTTPTIPTTTISTCCWQALANPQTSGQAPPNDALRAGVRSSQVVDSAHFSPRPLVCSVAIRSPLCRPPRTIDATKSS